MLQGQREGSMKSNAKGRRRVVEGRGGEKGGGEGGEGGEDRAALSESNEEGEHLVYLS